MISEKIYISKERNAYIETYLIEDSTEFHPGITRPVVVICPGGGYSYHSPREGEPIALRFLSYGYHAVVLYYGVGEYAAAPGPLKDLADTVMLLRSKSAEWHIDPDAVFTAGFSAGAHVAGQLGVFWNSDIILPDYKEKRDLIRPNGMLLGYPVLDLHESSKHLDIGIKPGANPKNIEFSQKHPKMPLDKMFVMDETEGRYFINFEQSMNAYIFDGEYTDEQEDLYSLNLQVTKDCCPAFIWHCQGDGLIFPQNSLSFAAALNSCDIPYELHIFQGGGHGISLADLSTAGDRWNRFEPAETWMPMAITWLNRVSGFAEKIEKLIYV